MVHAEMRRIEESFSCWRMICRADEYRVRLLDERYNALWKTFSRRKIKLLTADRGEGIRVRDEIANVNVFRAIPVLACQNQNTAK
jgi:hypothetical protein